MNGLHIIIKVYYIKIHYISVSGNKIYGDFSSVKLMIMKIKAPSIKIKTVKRQDKISWNKVKAYRTVGGKKIYSS